MARGHAGGALVLKFPRDLRYWYLSTNAPLRAVVAIAAARKNGWLDEMIMRANDLIFAFPSLVIAILITAIFGAGAVNAIIAIGIFNIPVFARVTRGGALSLWEREFILSAQVAGKSGLLISVEHILPNLAITCVYRCVKDTRALCIVFL